MVLSAEAGAALSVLDADAAGSAAADSAALAAGAAPAAPDFFFFLRFFLLFFLPPPVLAGAAAFVLVGGTGGAASDITRFQTRNFFFEIWPRREGVNTRMSIASRYPYRPLDQWEAENQ